MPANCLSVIGATGGQFPSMSLDFGPLRVVGITAPDIYALTLPFDAIVLPDATTLDQDAKRFSGSIFPPIARRHPDLRPQDIHIFTDLLPGRHVIKVSQEYHARGSDDRENGAAASTVCILRAASQMRLSALLFISPLGSGVLTHDEAASAFANALFTFVRNFKAQALRELVVCVENEDILRGIFRELERLHRERYDADSYRVDMGNDPFATEVRAFLDERSRPEAERSSLIVSSSLLLDHPMHMVSVYADAAAYKRSPEDGPPEGYIRPIPDFLVERAMRMVPLFVRGHGPEHPPPLLLARLIRDENFGEFETNVGGRKRVIQSRNLLSHCGVEIDNRKTKKRYLLSEIGLQDLPRETLAHSDLIRHFLMSSIFPKSQARFIRDIVGNGKLPADVIARIEREYVEIPLAGFSAAEVDASLTVMFLHECAEILWYVLPSRLKQKWKKSYPMDGNGDKGYIYFRNLIRLYTEWDPSVHDRESFFAQETFADALALYWMQNPTRYHRLMAGDAMEGHRGFFGEVMEWARLKFERDGSVFMI